MQILISFVKMVHTLIPTETTDAINAENALTTMMKTATTSVISVIPTMR